MKKPRTTQGESVAAFSPDIVEKAIITGLKALGYLPPETEVKKVNVWRCKSGDKEAIGVRLELEPSSKNAH